MKIQVTFALITLLTAATATAFSQAAADTYKSKCAMCHGADGAGDTPAGKAMKVPSFASPDAVKASDADLIAITKTGKGKMPAYTGKIPDDQIKDLVVYIRTLQKK